MKTVNHNQIFAWGLQTYATTPAGSASGVIYGSNATITYPSDIKDYPPKPHKPNNPLKDLLEDLL